MENIDKVPRFSSDKHDAGYYVIRDRQEKCAFPAGRDSEAVTKLTERLNSHSENPGFLVVDGTLYICWKDYKSDDLHCDWTAEIRQCNTKD